MWPENLPLTARFGVIEYDGRDEQTLTESIELARNFKAGGLDLLSVSVGFTIADTQIPWGPAFLGPIAERLRREAGIPVTSAWGFGTPQLAAVPIVISVKSLTIFKMNLLLMAGTPSRTSTRIFR